MVIPHIAICEDDKREADKIAALLDKWLSTYAGAVGTVHRFETGDALLTALARGEQFNLFLLDVLMPGMNGIELGTVLRQRYHADGEIVYISSSREFAVDSYDVNALYYLLKPVAEDRLFDVLHKAMERLALQKDTGMIVPTASGDRYVAFDDILYVERVGRCAQYCCTSGVIKSTTLRRSFSEVVQPLLADKRFCLCGASFVLNLHKIHMINNQTAYLFDGTALPLPRGAAPELKKAWGGYWLEEGGL